MTNVELENCVVTAQYGLMHEVPVVAMDGLPVEPAQALLLRRTTSR